MAGGDVMDVGIGELPGLAGTLREGAVSLDAAGATIPTAPDAGESTAVVAEGMAGMTETIAALTAAIDACGAGVEEDGRCYSAAENANHGTFEGSR